MKLSLEQKIIYMLYEAGKDGIRQNVLYTDAGVKKKNNKQFRAVLKELEFSGVIYVTGGKYKLKARNEYFRAQVTRVARTFGFITETETGAEYFVRGRDLCAAMPGDTVLAVRISEERRNEDDSDTARVVLVEDGGGKLMTGTIVKERGELKLRPDGFVCDPLTIIRWNNNMISEGDKVSFSVHSRAERHSDFTVDINKIYGKADTARVCVYACLDEKGINPDFPEQVKEEARAIESRGIPESELSSREDLRAVPIFTIDGADTKDIDDAVSIEKTDGGYRLGVHIADVSHYVKKGSALAKEAHTRGTSVYIADLVIPMLPPELSNGICSLNPGEDRLAFSCLMELNEAGTVTAFRFSKTVIRSRVKGVYTEVNAIIDGTASEGIKEKYSAVSGQIPVMCALTGVLIKNRIGRGAPDIGSRESKIICDENGVCVDIKERTRGFSEQVIEEFMLLANGCAARLAMDKGFPFVYRVHEKPEPEKLLRLSETLAGLGIDNKGVNETSTAADIAQLLIRTKDDPRAPVISNLVLRTMMKAKYSEEPLGHYGLVLREYSHFTSPIRRLADLSIHRILSDYAGGMTAEKLVGRYERFAQENAARASLTELAAIAAERDGDRFYMAEYMKKHIGEEFDGLISGVIGNGFFVGLESTVEGRVDISSLPEGDYMLENDITLRETLSGKGYTVGDPIRVVCAGCDVSAGTVEFVPAGTSVESGEKG